MTDGRVPRGRLRRTMPLTGFTARAAGGRVVAALRERAGDDGAVDRYHERTAARYAELLGHSKGLMMKAGQMFSVIEATGAGSGASGPNRPGAGSGASGPNRPGGILSPYQRALARLQADAPPMHPDLARSVIEDDLGRPVGEVFAEFASEPMAAASIGQVHRATLPDGRSVAVKVQYPGVAEAIRDDLRNTELVSSALRLMGGPMSDLRGATAEIAERIGEELDYRREARNIAAFAELYAGHPHIVVPEPVPGASGDRVLTMSYLDGMDWAAAQTADQELKNVWAEVLSRMITGSYRHADLFHADPHPGNFRFRPDGRVGLLDFGCVKVLSEPVRHRMVSLLRATVEGRREDLHGLMAAAGFFPDGVDLSVDDAYGWWASMVTELMGPQPATFTAAQSEQTVRALIDVRSSDHPVRRMTIPRDYVFFSRISLSIGAMLATLGATFYARAALDDMDGVAAPVSEVGRAHEAWVRSRGLPHGMDHHV
ncbi:AarF/ABC1/UbiB kinase family protein [Tsukamurella sp. 8F]|uniref:ABC1 kinase family protein n=1 Tax=unclassified Tsukamurella TaxID=2633480 RepID=UPI0023B8D88E|nr:MULTISPECIES: AarF/ABC1/UbiB kinase family protein [unclassified Tsukamurella]MDF0529063.1 AarF/ABC1/UbiB kinase family protein [Tsukamurella sp. 8J]MDF0587437.1 AarF/ABC1/UbiB kinase family protein [Tsukamurella sp. 8F]